MKYMIWNNKGGVGKTFLTYVFASEYALDHPECDVVVIDLCPQANISEMLLGGDGKGEENLSALQNSGKTIAGYIKTRFDKSRSNKLGYETSYFVPVAQFNQHMPSNLYLLPGDMDLDICSQLIEYMARAPVQNAWEKSRTLLRDLVDSFVSEKRNKPLIFFIDCNPSFASYTEMAVVTSDRIIVPCTADSASVRGIHNLFRMIYSIRSEKSLCHTDEQETVFDTFTMAAKIAKVKLPMVHLFVQNKSRSSEKKAAKAFKAHVAKIDEVANRIRREHAIFFSAKDELVMNVKDGNTLAAIMNHIGEPLRQLVSGPYEIYGNMTQANAQQIESLKGDVKKCLALL